MVVDFTSVFLELQAMGIYDFILPFLLVFAILFAVLEKLQIFGNDKKNVNLIIALISGLILISRPEITYLINNFIPKVSMFIIVVLMFLVIAGMFGAKAGDWSGYALFVAFIISILAIIWALYPGSAFIFPEWFRPDAQEKAWIILIVTIVIVISYIGRSKTSNDSWIEKFANSLKGK